MRAFTDKRDSQTRDQLWVCEHYPIYTLGLSVDETTWFTPQSIPTVKTDRGGQVTYHGPGQIVAYPLLNLKRLGYYVREYVYRLETALLRTLLDFGITGHRIPKAPGIYVCLDHPSSHHCVDLDVTQLGVRQDIAKIAALGIKLRRCCSYHGLCLNVAMDLSPYQDIHPCGYQGLPMIDMQSLGIKASILEVTQVLVAHLQVTLLPHQNLDHLC
jgi:lipoyl(octanoyl) transferase